MWLCERRLRLREKSVFKSKEPLETLPLHEWLNRRHQARKKTPQNDWLIPLSFKGAREALSTVACTCFVRGFLGSANQMNIRVVVELDKITPCVVIKERLCLWQGSITLLFSKSKHRSPLDSLSVCTHIWRFNYKHRCTFKCFYTSTNDHTCTWAIGAASCISNAHNISRVKT